MNGRNGKSGVYVCFCGNGEHGRRMPSALAGFEARDGAHVEAVPCTGRIDPRYIMKAFESGADAVCVLACPTGHCKSMQGNLRAARRVELAREMLAEAGMDRDAARIFLPASPEADTLEAAVQIVARFVRSTKKQEALV